jgi:hypothetical protein
MIFGAVVVTVVTIIMGFALCHEHGIAAGLTITALWLLACASIAYSLATIGTI